MSLKLPLVFWNGPPKLTITACIITSGIPRVITGTRGGLCVMWKLSINNDSGINTSQSRQTALTLGEINSCEPFAIMRGHETAVTAITECKYDQADSAASISSDGSLYLWGLQDGRCMAAAPFLLRGTPTSITALPGGNYVACGGRNNEIEVVDLTTFRVVRKIEGHSESITSLACGSFHRQTILLSVSEDSTLRYWRFLGSDVQRLLPGYSVDSNSTRPLSVSYNEDWSAILVVSLSKWHIFSFQGYKPVITCPAHDQAFLEGGAFIDNRHVIIYSVGGGAYIYRLPELPTPSPPSPQDGIADAPFMPQVQSMAMVGKQERNTMSRPTPESSRRRGLAGEPGASTPPRTSARGSMRKSISTTALNFLGAIGLGKGQGEHLSQDDNYHDHNYSMDHSQEIYPSSPTPRSPSRVESNTYQRSRSPVPIPASARHTIFSPSTPDANSGTFSHSPFDVAAAIEQAQSTSIFNEENSPRTADSPTINISEEGESSESISPPTLVRIIERTEDVAAWHCSGGCVVRATSQGILTIWQPQNSPPSASNDQDNTNAYEEIFSLGKVTSERLEDGWPKNEKDGRRITSSHFAVEKNTPPRLVQGFDNGTILVHPGVVGEEPLHFKGHAAKVTCLLVTHRSGKRILVSGGADFSVKVWDMSPEGIEKPLKTFHYHSSTVSMLFVPPREIRKKLQNCFCSIGEDRSVVLYSLKTLERVHLFGGHSSTVVAAYWRSDLDYLLVRCIDGSVYVWQLSTGVLERRLSGKAAADLIERSEGPGSSRRKATRMLYVSSATHSSSAESGRQGYVESIPVPINDQQPDIQVIMVSIRRLIAYIYNEAERIQRAASDSDSRSLPAGLACVLGYLLHPVSNAPQIQSLLHALGIQPPPITPHIGVRGASGTFTLIVPRMSEQLRPFMFSPVLSALTSLASTSVLSALSSIDPLRVPCQQSINYFLNILPHEMKPFEEPSFLWCSQFLKESFRDIQSAADAVMRSVVSRLSTAQTAKLSDNLTNYLLENYEDKGPRKQNLVVALAVLAATGASVDARVLSIVAIGLIEIIERGGSHHATAISLLGEAFHLFEAYVPDTEGVYRQLFQLSVPGLTNNSSNLMDGISGDAIQAMINISATDVRLFLDLIHKILGDPQHTEHNTLRAGIVLISLVVKQFPAILVKHLADIISTILRVLDPHFPAVREACLNSSTMTLRSIVNIYPMVSFFQIKQKLAVGNAEGVVIMYDLRTASKWQVFEGHAGAIAALAFSPTGDLLASYSYQDHTCRVWQIDGAGMFNMLGVSNRAIKKVDTPVVEPMSAEDIVYNVRLAWESPIMLTLKPSKQATKISFNVK